MHFIVLPGLIKYVINFQCRYISGAKVDDRPYEALKTVKSLGLYRNPSFGLSCSSVSVSYSYGV